MVGRLVDESGTSGSFEPGAMKDRQSPIAVQYSTVHVVNRTGFEE